jgi:putative DNA primase/helicase
MTAAELLDRLDGVQRDGQGWKARCPAHEDARPSLGVLEGTDGRIVLRCRAGCDTSAVLAALGLEMRDLFAEPQAPNGRNGHHRTELARYRYEDESSVHLFDVVRLPGKVFPQEPANGKRGPGCMAGVRLVLYRLPAVLAAVAAGEAVWITEGEKDADALVRAGLCSTCNPGGAGKWRPQYGEALRGARVVVVADQDEPGRAHAATVARMLDGVAESVDVVTAASGKDAADHLAAGLGVGDFEPLAEAPEAEAALPVIGAPALAYVSLETVRMRSITWLERPLWQLSAFHLLAGVKGAGKGTYLAQLTSKITRGLAPDSPRTVVFVSSEDSLEVDLKPRLVAAGADLTRVKFISEAFRLPDDLERLAATLVQIGDVAAAVVDPVSNHIGSRDSNSEAEVRDAIAGLNALADRLQCSIIGVRHVKKDRRGGALASILGSTAWVDTPRAVLVIARDDQEDDVRHVQVVAGNRSATGGGIMFRISTVDLDGLDEPVTLATEIGESVKDIDELFAPERKAASASKTAKARDLILDTLEAAERLEMESDTLDAQVAGTTGLNARTVQNIRTALSKEGLVKSRPVLTESGQPARWIVLRTGAPRP